MVDVETTVVSPFCENERIVNSQTWTVVKHTQWSNILSGQI